MFKQYATYEIFTVATEVRLLKEGRLKFVSLDLEDVLLFDRAFSVVELRRRHENLFVLLSDLLLQVMVDLLVQFVVELVIVVVITGRLIG